MTLKTNLKDDDDEHNDDYEVKFKELEGTDEENQDDINIDDNIYADDNDYEDDNDNEDEKSNCT
jgi:hypothetical protein